MEEFLGDSIEVFEDRYLIAKTSHKLVKQQKEELEKFCEQVAGIMPELKTDTGRQELAELTQGNFKAMIELDIQLAQLEKVLKLFEIMKGQMF